MEPIYKREYRPNFEPEVWVDIYKRLKELKRMTGIPLQHRKICIEVIENKHSTAELHRLAGADKNYQWLKSNRGNPMCTRQIQNILWSYFPEFHLNTTNKKNPGKNYQIRKEQHNAKKKINKGVCYRCGATQKLELHHMIPVAMGGTNDDGNVIILCEDCHRLATDYFIKNIKRGEENET